MKSDKGCNELRVIEILNDPNRRRKPIRMSCISSKKLKNREKDWPVARTSSRDIVIGKSDRNCMTQRIHCRLDTGRRDTAKEFWGGGNWSVLKCSGKGLFSYCFCIRVGMCENARKVSLVKGENSSLTQKKKGFGLERGKREW